jgi:hypothetical protein
MTRTQVTVRLVVGLMAAVGALTGVATGVAAADPGGVTTPPTVVPSTPTSITNPECPQAGGAKMYDPCPSPTRRPPGAFVAPLNPS